MADSDEVNKEGTGKSGKIDRPANRLEKGFEKIISPFEEFIQNGATGSVLLIICTAFALFIANSPWSDSYERLVHNNAGIIFGDWEFIKSIRHWINDGLMALFFFIIGLEIKRELLVGELRDISRSLTVFASSLGGMILPALIYILFNAGTAGINGWGIPMATDTAFAVGILVLLRQHVPASLAAFLTALAIIDDIGAVLVIAAFYTDTIHIVYLAWAGLILLLLIFCNFLGINRIGPYLLLGLLLWSAMLSSGVHASISGILVAMTIPARPQKKAEKLSRNVKTIRRKIDKRIDETGGGDVLSDSFQHRLIDQLRLIATQATTPLQHFWDIMEKPVALLILPVFALANAGVSLNYDDLSLALQSSISWGIGIGLIAGKISGITGGYWLATRLGRGRLPSGMNIYHVIGIGLLGAVGFTMSIFIADLGFKQDIDSLNTAKTAVLLTSILAGTGGYLWLRFIAGKYGK